MKSMLRIVHALALGALTAACSTDGASQPAAKTSTPAPAPAAPAKAAEPAAPSAPDFTVTARDLYAEFRPQIEAGTADKVRAKYTGKTVRISGEVKDNTDILGTRE